MSKQRRTERAYRTQDPEGKRHFITAGWDPDESGYYIEILKNTRGDEWGVIYNSREACNCRISFADITFILCRHALTYPTRWAKRLLEDNPFLNPERDPPKVSEFGFHPKLRRSTKPTE